MQSGGSHSSCTDAEDTVAGVSPGALSGQGPRAASTRSYLLGAQGRWAGLAQGADALSKLPGQAILLHSS